VYEISGGFQVERGRLPAGDAGTTATLEKMRRLVHEGSRQLPVRWTAVRLVRAAGVPSHDVVGMLGALHRYVRDRITFVGDIAGVETLQSPRYTMASGAGDCDDRAVLLASLARAIGVPTSFRVIAADPRNRSRYSHVYVVAHVGKRRIAMDPTYGENALGWEYPNPYRVGDMSL